MHLGIPAPHLWLLLDDALPEHVLSGDNGGGCVLFGSERDGRAPVYVVLLVVLGDLVCCEEPCCTRGFLPLSIDVYQTSAVPEHHHIHRELDILGQ